MEEYVLQLLLGYIGSWEYQILFADDSSDTLRHERPNNEGKELEIANIHPVKKRFSAIQNQKSTEKPGFLST